MNGGNGAATDERGGVVDPRAGVLGKSQDDARVLHFLPYPVESQLDLAAKAAVKQQILGGVTRERELREHHEIGAELRTSTTRRRDHAGGVSMHIANQKVELCEGNFERVAHEIGLPPQGGQPSLV